MPTSKCSRAVLTLCILAAASPLFGEVRIEWVPVAGADHYRVEVRRNGVPVLETRSDAASIPVYLPPGSYEFRVGVFSAFGGTAAFSDWMPLRIFVSVRPFVLDVGPNRIYEDQGAEFQSRVTGYADEFAKVSTFYFEGPNGDRVSLDTEVSEVLPGEEALWDQVVLRSEEGGFYPGTWNFVMVSDAGKESRIDGALTVLERTTPRIGRITPNRIQAGEDAALVAVRATGLEADAELRFDGPSAIAATVVGGSSGDVIFGRLDLTETEPGWYSVTVANPSGEMHTMNRFLRILPETGGEGAVGEAGPQPPPPAPEPERAEHPHALIAGYGMSFTINTENVNLGNGFAGFSAGYSQYFGHNLIRQIPALRRLGWEATLIYSGSRTQFPHSPWDAGHLNLLLGAVYVTPFDSPVNLLARFGGGLGVTFFFSAPGSTETQPGGRKFDSPNTLDFLARFGLGIRWDLGPRFFIDLTADLTAVFYAEQTGFQLQPRLEGGWRW